MARRTRTAESTTTTTNLTNPTEAPAEVTDTTEENVVSDTTSEAPEAPTAGAEAPVESTSTPTTEVDLTAFEAAVAEAQANKDDATGVPATVFIERVRVAYRDLPGVKAKNAAKKALNEKLSEAMAAMEPVTARAYFLLGESLAGAAAAAPRAERQPVDPTEAFVQRVAGLGLAYSLTTESVPEGVNEDWNEKVSELVNSSIEGARGYVAWLTSDDEDKGDEPEVSAVVKAAVKLSQGKSAKVGGKTPGTSASTPYTGDRRDIAKHIQEAFADKNDGDFLSVAEIRKFRSEEYGDSQPSAGAISARLFPKDDKPCTVEGVRPGQSEDGKGNKGAYKVA